MLSRAKNVLLKTTFSGTLASLLEIAHDAHSTGANVIPVASSGECE